MAFPYRLFPISAGTIEVEEAYIGQILILIGRNTDRKGIRTSIL
jgi:hypothetical protein